MLGIGCGRTPAVKEEENRVAPVKAVAAEKLSLGEWTEMIGTTQPLPGRAARVSAIVEGRVLSLLGDDKLGRPLVEGQQVMAGDVIVHLDDRIARSNRDRVSYTLKDLEEQKRQADLAIELAQIEVKRLEELAKSNPAGASLPLVSRIELEKARVSLKDAESKQKGVLAKQDSTKQELNALAEQLKFYTLRSPLSGRLGMVQVLLGQTVPVGTTIAEVIDLREIDVLCYVPPKLAARLSLDQVGQIEDERRRLLAPKGRVVFIALQAQPDTGNFAVKVRFLNPDWQLRSNTIHQVQVLTKPVQDRLTVPMAAVMEDQDPATVVVVTNVTAGENGKKTGTARILQATLGVRDRVRQKVEILELIDPEKQGETKVGAISDMLFVIEGGHGLHNGDAVQVDGGDE